MTGAAGRPDLPDSGFILHPSSFILHPSSFPPMPAIVRIVDLVKNYYMGSQTVHVLKDLNLAFDEGDFVALMGPSGSGKSTLLNVLGCLDRPTSGNYFLGDVDVSEMSDDQLSEVRSTYLGFIFQSYNLLPQYTVVENIELPLLYQGIKLDEKTRDRCVSLAGSSSASRSPAVW